MQYLYLKKDILLQNFIDFYIVNIYNITQQFDIYYVKILLDTVKLMRPCYAISTRTNVRENSGLKHR